MKKIYLAIILGLIILGTLLYLFFPISEKEEIVNETVLSDSLIQDAKSKIIDENTSKDNNINDSEELDSDKLELINETYNYKGILEDVTGGKIVTGIDTDNKATGIGMAKFENGKYKLFVEFENLPDPVDNTFYEGWLVKKGLISDIISTGKVQKENGIYKNRFESYTNLTDYNFYVLTIEPNDDNPEPADHILETTLDIIK